MNDLQKDINKDLICWNDKWAIIIGAPIVSLLIPFVFFGIRFNKAPQFTFPIYITTLLTTLTLWLGNRAIMIWARTRYTGFAQLKKRLTVQSILMLIFTPVISLLIGYLLEDYCLLNQLGLPEEEIIILSINSSIFTTIAITSIYEVVYFIQQLKESLTRSEDLKREGLRAELNALKTQVNPHFLFNNLNTLCAIIPEDPKKAVTFVEQLSKVYRYILEVRDEKTIPLREEIQILKAYAFLLNTRFGNNFQLNMDIPEKEMQTRIVPFSLQLLVENALKHNIVSGENPLHITLTTNEGQLIVRNNIKKKQQVEKSTGIGLMNIRNRYKLLTEKLVTVTETPQDFIVALPLI
jgi:two-component system, LytTR family, sensor kinase